MSMPDVDTINKWREEIKQKLFIEKQSDITIPYWQVSLAFPGGPHSATFDHPMIDWNAFAPWAKELGWHVQAAPEATHPDQQATPRIRFTRIT